MSIPSNYRFAESHEWVLDNGDGTVTLGISDHAQQLLGDIVFVDLPEVGTEVTAGSEFSLVESVKAASDIYAAVSGEVIAVNEVLEDEPEAVNNEPYAGGWIAKIRLSDPTELDSLLDADTYNANISDEG
ncbi:MAG: glycine cleavage system protein GcvH [Thiolinea sp.]